MSRDAELFALFDRVVADLRRLGCPTDEARDIAQEAIGASWKNLRTIQSGSEWVYVRTAARNIASKRGKRRRPTDSVSDELPSITHSQEAALIEREETRRFRESFKAAMSDLPVETQRCVALRRHGLSYKQIAAELGVSLSAVQARLHRANEHFRSRVEKPPEGVRWAELLGDDDDHQG